jgi:predicted  nucleic acid-binding Zn-ribbon protein
MACLEHECQQCYAMWHSNEPLGLACPECGSGRVHTWLDEEPEYEDADREWEDEPCTE